MKRVIITGASSPIGSQLIKILPKNCEILLLYHRVSQDSSKRITFDLHNIDSDVISKINNFKADTMFHLAWGDATVSTHESYNHFESMVGSLCIINNFFKSGGKTLIGIGTYAEYGNIIDKKIPFDELMEAHPITGYAKLRLGLYSVLNLMCERINVNFTWARIFSSFGNENNPNRLTYQIIDGLQKNQEVTIKTSQLIRDFIYTKEIARALLLLAENNSYNGIVNICSSQPLSIEKYAKLIAKLMGKEQYLICNAVQTTQPDYIVGSNKKLMQLCDYRPKYRLEDAILDLLREKAIL